eukprot:GHVH01004098.1.p1 GENE.GHVH01004098.1~~GHVH01004098.1.p1  ORF type:complete len:805 (+),score=89.44 GHVH01004098.1:294-2417(+)
MNSSRRDQHCAPPVGEFLPMNSKDSTNSNMNTAMKGSIFPSVSAASTISIGTNSDNMFDRGSMYNLDHAGHFNDHRDFSRFVDVNFNNEEPGSYNEFISNEQVGRHDDPMAFQFNERFQVGMVGQLDGEFDLLPSVKDNFFGPTSLTSRRSSLSVSNLSTCSLGSSKVPTFPSGSNRSLLHPFESQNFQLPPVNPMNQLVCDSLIDISSRIPLPIHSLLGESEATWSPERIDWQMPYTEELTQSQISQLFMNNILSSDRLLSIFELSIFRTVLCVSSCDNRRSHNLCWASHSYDSNGNKRWLRRNPFIHNYKHLMCPEIQSLKEGMREQNKALGSEAVPHRLSEKILLQQACFKCANGMSCNYSHSLEEQMYHPFVYKTQLCNNLPKCERPFCPFLHEGEYYVENHSYKPRKYKFHQTWKDLWEKEKVYMQSSRDALSLEELPTRPSTDDRLADVGVFHPGVWSSANDWNAQAASTSNRNVFSSLAAAEMAFEEPMDRDQPCLEASIDELQALKFANRLFSNCRLPLSWLELSVFRTTRCPLKIACANNKFPTRCWATHASSESNRWLRRNPFIHNYKHLLCPVIRQKDVPEGKAKWLACPKGVDCNLSHSIEEQMYHPFVYKTSTCNNLGCDRPFCPFLHDGEVHTPFPNSLSHLLKVVKNEQSVVDSADGSGPTSVPSGKMQSSGAPKGKPRGKKTSKKVEWLSR